MYIHGSDLPESVSHHMYYIILLYLEYSIVKRHLVSRRPNRSTRRSRRRPPAAETAPSGAPGNGGRPEPVRG